MRIPGSRSWLPESSRCAINADTLETEITKLANKKHLTDGEQEHWDRCVRQRDRLVADIETLEVRSERTDDIRRRIDSGDPSIRMYDGIPSAPTRDQRVMSGVQGAALRALERLDMPARARGYARAADPPGPAPCRIRRSTQPERILQRFRQVGDARARDGAFVLLDLERAALHDSLTLRAAQDTAITHGGFALPVFIDPSVILTNQESDNPFLRIVNVVNITTNQWKGVSVAGVSWSFDAEGAEVSDYSITLASLSVDVFTARGFIPFTIEVGEDWPGFQQEMGRLSRPATTT